MSWFDFFEKKEAKNKTKLSFKEVISRIDQEKDKSEIKCQRINEEIKRNLLFFISELKSQVHILKSVTLEQRREQEKIKKIVLENLYFYISLLEKLIKDLEETDENVKTEVYINKIQDIFNNFKKRAYKSFEKSTILIGKELEIVQKIIKTSFKNFNEIIDENKEVFEKRILIEQLQNLVQEIYNTKDIQEEIKNSIKGLVKTKNELQIEKGLVEKQYEYFKEGREFQDFLKQKEKIKEERNELNQEILRTKEKINLKFLLKHFHEDPKKNSLLTNYKDNFLDALDEDKDLEIIKIIKEVYDTEIDEEINKIKQKNDELKIDNKNDAEKEANSLVDKIKDIALKIMNIEDQIQEESKKASRFGGKEKQQLNEFNTQVKNILEEVEIIG